MQINFNSASNAALQQLRSITADIFRSQARITTGQRSVAEDPSRYALSQRFASDVVGYDAVGSSLALGRQAVEVAIAGAEGLNGLAAKMKDVILRANEPAADLDSLDAELTSLKRQYRTIVNSTTFNGQNLLINDDPIEALSGIARQSDGTIETNSFTVNRQNFLFEVLTTVGSDPGTPISGVAVSGDGSIAAGDSATITATDYSPTAGDEFKAEINGTTYSYQVQAGDSAADVFTNYRQVIANGAAIELQNINADYQQTQDPFFPLTGSRFDTIEIRNDETSAITINLSTVAAGTGNPGTQVLTSRIDELSVSDTDQAAQALNDIADIQDGIISKTSTLGTTLSRFEIQEDFVATLSATAGAAASRLTDIDIAAESVRLEEAQFRYELALAGLDAVARSRASILQLIRSF
ncbi:flagellin [Parvularcula sp. ZS-1/3]|uniref:Flagellin n=1 Tax=Parvularcula mediterranea TaxID=2732508 RepID=A0A7Y3RJV5_9PROT|nr:flagellin [Parvularcula mediterranea]NNU15325.1 flagellin [Parvularcula mediterranea]